MIFNYIYIYEIVSSKIDIEEFYSTLNKPSANLWKLLTF